MLIRYAPLILSLAVSVAGIAAETTTSPPVTALIKKAGNAEEDRARLEILKQLAGRQDLTPKLKAECPSGKRA